MNSMFDGKSNTWMSVVAWYSYCNVPGGSSKFRQNNLFLYIRENIWNGCSLNTIFPPRTLENFRKLPPENKRVNSSIKPCMQSRVRDHFRSARLRGWLDTGWSLCSFELMSVHQQHSAVEPLIWTSVKFGPQSVDLSSALFWFGEMPLTDFEDRRCCSKNPRRNCRTKLDSQRGWD